MLTYPIKVNTVEDLNEFLTKNKNEILEILQKEQKQKQAEYHKKYRQTDKYKQRQKES